MAEKQEIDAACRRDVMDQLKQQFRPEFINRIDEIVLFEPLRQSDIAQVVDLQMARLSKLAADKRITLELTAKGREFLAAGGLRPDLRRPAAEAGDPEARAGSPGPASCSPASSCPAIT